MGDEWPGQRLHQYAIYDRHDAMIDILEGDEQQNINALDKCGRTPVYTAVSNNSIKCLEVLLQHGADPNIAGGEKVGKMTPLHQALYDYKVDAIKLLLRYGADLNHPDETGMSSLQLAKSINTKDYIEIFEEENNRRKQNALKVVEDLCRACEERNLEMVREILLVPPPAGTELANMQIGNENESQTPLSVAAVMGNTDIMLELLGTVRELTFQPSVIHLACEAGHPEIVKLLLQRFPESGRMRDDSQKLPFHVACQTGSLEIVKILLEWDYPASQYQSVVDEEMHLEYKLPFQVNDRCDGKSALFMACENGHEEVVDYLLNYRVKGIPKGRQVDSDSSSDSSVSGEDDDGFVKPVLVETLGDVSKIHFTATGEAESASYQSDVSAKQSCAYISVLNGHLRIVEMLQEHGARLDLTSKENGVEYSLLLKLALENNDPLMLNKLLQLEVQDINNYVFEEAMRRNPMFVSHFLKHKTSEDKTNPINRKLMKKEYRTSTHLDEGEKLRYSDPKYEHAFPTLPVSLRWQNLKVLATVEQSWLAAAVNMFNPNLSTLSKRMPMFAVTKVDVSHNSLTMVPAAVLQLPSLCTLTASHNKIVEFPSLTNFNLDGQFLEELNIQHNHLHTIPDYIFTLPKLRVLNASHNEMQKLPASMWSSAMLKTLDLSHNKIELLPKPVGIHVRTDSDNSMEPTSLDDSFILEQDPYKSSSNDSHVIYCTVTKANHWADSLMINDEAVKSAEDQKKGLKTLKLGHNLLSAVPEFLSCCCPQLEYLEIPKNSLGTLGNLAVYPKYLKSLDVSQNRILSMEDWQMEDDRKKCFLAERSHTFATSGLFSPPSLSVGCGHRNHSKLENLDTLDLSANGLSIVVLLRSHGTASFTKSTEFSKNTLLEKENIEKSLQGRLLFPNLTCLHLDKNSITSLPDDIQEMTSLRVLTLKQNTHLRQLPPVLGLLDHLQRIEVDMCPLEGPIQDVIRGASNKAADIIGFLRSVLEESEEYNCMNLMIVGSFDVGKTSLLQLLMKKGKSNTPMMHYNQRQDSTAAGFMRDGRPLSTVGIDIGQLVLEGKHGKVEFRTWDFAGQIEYYATHQYFLSPRSLYLVVWNLTKGEPGVEGLRQWLVNIQAQAPGASVIIVGTHLDEIQKKRRNYPSDWEASLVQMIHDKYQRVDNENVGLPKVLDIINVSASKGTNIDKLYKKIYEKVFTLTHPARKTEKLLGHKVPKKYLKLQNVIREIARMQKIENKEPVLDASAYLLKVMNEMSHDDSSAEFRSKEDLNQATRFLHENGVLCHFEDLALRDQYFLDPQWLCDQLAKVVSIKEVQQYCKNGVMKLQDMFKLYQDSDKVGQYILSLLSKFEVALQFDGEHLLLPSLLPVDEGLSSENMKEIPLRRKGMVIATPNQSVVSVGSIGKLFDPQTNASREDCFSLLCAESHSNPAFSNTRLYLLTYFPSGFWPRLITRILADDSFFEPSMRMYQFPQEVVEKCPDVQRESPKWRCWQTGFEMIYFGNVILQVKEVRNKDYARGMCDYVADGLKIECHFDSQWGELDVEDSVILEISFKADRVTFNFGCQEQSSSGGFRSIEPRDIYHDEKAKTSILAKIVEHIDGLLQDWFPEIGEARFIQSLQGRYLVTRVVPCPQCLQAEIQYQQDLQGQWEMLDSDSEQRQYLSIGATDLQHKADVQIHVLQRTVCTFLVERCIKNVLEGMDEICKVHGSVSPKCMPSHDGVTRILHIAPDAVFQDLDEAFVVEDDAVQVIERLGQGAFGTVSRAKLRRGENSVFDVAVKVLYDPSIKERRKTNQTTQICLETICAAYTTARQEVSILQTVEHAHIVPLLGLSRRPLALLLSLAPLGSLHKIFEERHKDGLLLPVSVVRQVVIQVADALDYLHRRSIIYRDLKADNVLVWNIPGPNDLDPRQPVLVKLADYGISKSVLPGGTKGFGGTPPFIAPEILMHTGRDTYTEKVDIFSFGMFMFELLTCRQPLGEINNINVHVVHGGRPTLTTEEAVFPSHMLDLMNICWDPEPESRPSAAHIRMIASSPQFCHLSDAVTMEAETYVLSATSVFVESADLPETRKEKEDHSQVWMLTQERKEGPIELSVLSYNTRNKCVGHQEIKQDDKNKLLAVCAVERHVWCLDQHGVIHIFSSDRLEQLDDLQLPVKKLEDVKSISYHPDCGKYFVFVLKEEEKRSPEIFCCTETMLRSRDPVEPIVVPGNVFCAAVAVSSSGTKLWHGGKDSAVYVRSIDQLMEEPGCLYAYEELATKQQQCRFIATPVNMPSSHSIWTYNYPGSKVFRWDTNEEKVVAILDCANKIPATESCFHRTKKFEANHYQVTAMSAVGGYLYIGTTWGCVLVADAFSMHAYSVFRCHGSEGFYCKAILQIGPRGCLQYPDIPLNSIRKSHTFPRSMLNKGKEGGEQSLIYKLKNQGIVTVGRGYMDIIRSVTQLERQALLRQDTAEGWAVVASGPVPVEDAEVNRRSRSHTYLLSWETENWEHY